MNPPEALVVSTTGCHLCADAEAVLTELDHDARVSVRVVDSGSDEGRAIIARHRPSMFPLVLIDGEPFSVGRLPRGKLRRLLDAKAS
jgi:hypothetical protein